MNYIGIDIAKKAHEICLLDQHGVVVDGNTFKISNSQKGFEKLNARLTEHGFTPTNALVGMEATGHYWLVLFSWFIEQGYPVKVINPIVTDGYRSMEIRKRKTDRIDARVVADVLRFGLFQETGIAEEDILALRQLTRFRSWQVDGCSDLKRKIVAVLDQVFPEYESLFSDIFGATSRELLRTITTPEEFAKISTTKLGNLMRKCSRGQFGREKAFEVKAVAESSIGLRIANDSLAFQIQQMIEQIEFIEQQIKRLETEITAIMVQLNSPIQTIPGVGPVYGATILAELGNIHRFPSGKQVVSYAGLDASIKQSGEFEGTQNKMSKRGSPYLRRAILGAAGVASRSDPELTAYYQRLISRGKHHNVAIGALGRKLCYIIFSVLSENREFISHKT